MPTLNWIGKDKIISHHQDVPFRVLRHSYGFTEKGEQDQPAGSGNMIIHGDNLEALKALMPEYEGRIKCICIDPPYNTGAENWIYNDNVNHPRIQNWIRQVVGREGDDLSRHDKWLCMMYPRLRLMHRLLKEDGIIFINIDDNELHNLIAIMNEIFGPDNKISILSWDLGSGTSAGHFTRAHEYILVYAKNKALIANFSGGEGYIDDRAIKKIGFKNPASEFTFPKGTRFDAPDGYELTGEWGDSEKCTLLRGRMLCMDGKLAEDVTLSAGWTQKKQMKSWFAKQPTFDSKGQEVTEFYFRKNGKIYCRKKRETLNPPSVIRDLASSKTGSAELKNILGNTAFDFPKPSELVKYLVELSTAPGDIILDGFAGSGTLGHAVLKLNAGNDARSFIMIQMSETDKSGAEVNICELVTAERIKRVIQGYNGSEGLGGSFDYYEMGPPLFLAGGYINTEIQARDIRNYILYSETKSERSKNTGDDNAYYIGNANNTSYYFYFDPARTTTLDYQFLSTIKTRAEQYVIYADNCLLPEDFLVRHHIIFKKVPRDIARF